MATNSKIEIINSENLNEWLNSTGFLFPTNELELARFNKLYADYDFKLKDAHIDVQAIFNDNMCVNIKSLISFKEEDFDNKIVELRIAARKGNQNIPQHIIDKMIKHHTDDDFE